MRLGGPRRANLAGMSDTSSTAPTGRFDGSRVFVTGAASGIGAATVELFRSESARVVGVDVSAADGVAHCDVTDPASVQAAMAAAVEELGGLDVCVNVAGINRFSRIEELSLDLLQAHLSVNLIGPMLVTQAALPHLKESRGNVVTVASISGMQGQPFNSAYCASKGGVLLLMRSLAVELARHGVRVNCVCPGGVDTPLVAGSAASLPPDVPPKFFDKMSGVMGGFMPPSDIAEAIGYLASPAASSVTGASLVVDRGTLW
jgi:NAD(P)-dependent dehydrogenase (short-subunit alcohol dehydrogenase family)